MADAIRTSLGPRGMDKMIQKGDGEVIITNDGATILGQMSVFHPCAKMLVELSKSQDIEAGDGTTSVVVLAGSMLNACSELLQKGIHPTVIADSFKAAAEKAEEVSKHGGGWRRTALWVWRGASGQWTPQLDTHQLLVPFSS